MNADIFSTDVRDGISAMLIGKIGSIPEDIAMVGGNCSIVGYDKTGEEVFWSVSSDNVSALGYFRGDGGRLLVGSEDYTIRIFNSAEMLHEINESSKPTNFSNLDDSKFAYALDNGTLGVYRKISRKWRAKAKHQILSMAEGDIFEDGNLHIILGWSNGRLEIRSQQKGASVFKKPLKQTISKVFYEDFRLEGTKQVIACTSNGSVLGFIKQALPVQERVETQQEDLEDLQMQKQALLNELQAARIYVQPVDTNIQAGFTPEGLKIDANLLIKTVIIWAEGLFPGDSDAFHFSKPSTSVVVPLKNPKRMEIPMTVTAFISETVGSAQFKAVEVTVQLPKFLDYKAVNDCNPSGYVQFDFPMSSQLSSWVGHKFVVLDVSRTTFCFADGEEQLRINVQGGRMKVHSDTFAAASEVVSSLIQYFEVKELYSTANFPQEFSKLGNLMERVEEFNNARNELTINMAENSQNVKSLIVTAEDSRIQKNMQHFRQNLARLHQFNGQLLSEFQIRLNNHNELLSHLKELNQYIQRAADIRSGPPKTKIISACKEAIKNRDADSFVRLISSGNS